MNRAEKITSSLQQMSGNTFSYAKVLHHVSSVFVDEELQEFTITTNLNRYVRKFDSFENFIQYWTPAEQVVEVPATVEEVKNGSSVAVLMQQENNLADSMIEILRDNIKKVQDSPAYIDQAKAINNNVNSVLNIMKMKLTMYKEAKSKR